MSLSAGLSSTRPLPPVPRFTGRVLAQICGLFFLSRLLVLAVAAISHLVVEQGPFASPARTWMDRFFLWDATWYLGIAEDGYYYRNDAESSVGFYPLYPMLIRGAHGLGLDGEVAGYVISLAALFGACVLLWKLAALETRSERVAESAVLFLLFCPGSVWFGMIYTESLFLLTLLGCLFCARQGRWIAAGAWGLLAALTRTPGLLLAGFLFLEGLQQWWDQRRALAAVAAVPPPAVAPAGEVIRDGDDAVAPPSGMPRAWRVALGIAGPVLGHASYLAFLQVRFGDWRAQQRTVAAGWNAGSGFRWPWNALADSWQFTDRHMTVISMPLLAITVGLAVVGLFTLRRVGYAALVLALCVLYVSAATGYGLTRYLSTAAPVYLVLAQVTDRSRLLETTVLVFSVGMMVLQTVLLINGYHII